MLGKEGQWFLRTRKGDIDKENQETGPTCYLEEVSSPQYREGRHSQSQDSRGQYLAFSRAKTDRVLRAA